MQARIDGEREFIFLINAPKKIGHAKKETIFVLRNTSSIPTKYFRLVIVVDISISNSVDFDL